MHEYDRSSKWLIEHHGAALLRLAGLPPVYACRPAQAEVVQPRQLPDGLLEVRATADGPVEWFLVEIATYPQRRVSEQALRGALLVYLDRHQLPEVLTLVLCPKGTYRVPGVDEQHSLRDWTRL